MSPHQVVALFVRLFVIWIACILLTRLPNAYFLFQQNEISTFWVMVFLGVALVVLMLIWNFPVVVSNKLLPNSIAQETKPSSYDSWFEIGIVIMGLWLLVQAIPSIIQYVTLYIFNQKDPMQGSMPNTWNANLVGYIVQLLLSFAMLLNAPAIEKIVRKLRGR
jgi:hypothetical protein